MAPRFPELQDAGWLRRKYEIDGLSSYSIAAELGCRANTVSRALHRHGIAARMGRPAVVAPGQVYGRLTVLGELRERTRGGRVFRCLCACGREAAARAVELRQGQVRSCGCLLNETRQSGHTRPPSVHSGQRYARLVVLHEAARESPRDARMFSCRCDCGGTTTVRGANLTSGHTRSCGCCSRSTADVAAGRPSFPAACIPVRPRGLTRRRPRHPGPPDDRARHGSHRAVECGCGIGWGNVDSRRLGLTSTRKRLTRLSAWGCDGNAADLETGRRTVRGAPLMGAPGEVTGQVPVRGTEIERRAFFTPKTLAQYLAISERTVRSMLASGRIPSYRVEGARRIDPRDVDRYLANRRENRAA